MPTIEISFPGGRYHATPWGHHVNEGQIEWPPCPWRLLRALIAAGFNTQQWEDIPPVARSLIEKLASHPPVYELPPGSSAHSRHYMPTGKLEKKREKTTLVFDTWANIGDGQLRVRWYCELTAQEQEVFSTLIEAVGYLGRSESWIDGQVIDDDVEFAADRVAYPHRKGEYAGPNWEQFVLMSPVSPEAFRRWREERVEQALSELPLPDGKAKPSASLLKTRKAAEAPFPEDLLECLQKDTHWWKKQHSWSQPPGSQRTLYWRRADALVVATLPKRVSPPEHRVQAMLLALSTPTRNKSALPHVTRTLPQAELFHQAVIARVGKGKKIHCPELTGQDEEGQPLRNGHQHAHMAPLDLDGDQHLDHILIYSPMGLGSQAQIAIQSLKRTWTKGGKNALQVSFLGSGDLDQLRELEESLQVGVHELLGPPSGSRTWISKTPFVPPRHLKPRGKNTLIGQVEEEIRSRQIYPEVVSVESFQPGPAMRSFRHYIRVRGKQKPPPPRDQGFALRIEFAEPITGPLLLGYGAHFGLGQFAATIEQP